MKVLTLCFMVCLLTSSLIATPTKVNKTMFGVNSASKDVTDNTDNERVSREKREALKFGRCEPLQTTLGDGLQVLHEMHSKREKFFIRPRSTFRKVLLQVRLDNILPLNPPRVYNPGVEFSDTDLNKMVFEPDEWLEVVAEVFDHWKLRLSIKDWVKEVVVRNWNYHKFESLVLSGEGGCEWSFDCMPYDISYNLSPEESTFHPKLHDNSWWMVAAVAVGSLLLFVLMTMLLLWQCRSSQSVEQPPTSYVSSSMSYRRSRPSKKMATASSVGEEEIYEELAVTSLQKLQRKFTNLGIEGFPRTSSISKVSPPPLPEPNKTFAGQPGSDVCDVQDEDWYGTLEVHSSERGTQECGGKGSTRRAQQGSSRTGGTNEPFRHLVREADSDSNTAENPYTNCPMSSTSTDTYVDMRRYQQPR